MSENYMIVIRSQNKRILKLKKENYELKKRVKELEDLMQPKKLTDEDKVRLLRSLNGDDEE